MEALNTKYQTAFQSMPNGQQKQKKSSKALLGYLGLKKAQAIQKAEQFGLSLQDYLHQLEEIRYAVGWKKLRSVDKARKFSSQPDDEMRRLIRLRLTVE